MKGRPHRTCIEEKEVTQPDKDTLNFLRDEYKRKGTAVHTAEAFRRKAIYISFRGLDKKNIITFIRLCNNYRCAVTIRFSESLFQAVFFFTCFSMTIQLKILVKASTVKSEGANRLQLKPL